jgi:uncharacterized protein YbbC (DUF1343 family)
MSFPPVLSGLDVLRRQQFASLRGLRVGLVTHPAAVAADLTPAVELFAAALGGRLTTIFGPEHGLLGQAQDLIAVSEEESGAHTSNRRLVSLYGSHEASLHPTAEQLAEVDVLVIDLQDVGSRYYTFQATMLYCMQVALPLGKRVVVLDRPNPIGLDALEGPALQQGFRSFVGCHNIAPRHGLTMGEIARFYQQQLALPHAELLTVVACENLRRSMHFPETQLPWVLPSPNMPTYETALVYPGQCLLEGTNLSEGRGTTRPFELCGAPWLDGTRFADALNGLKLPGIHFRSTHFRPTFQKHAGLGCGGVQLHVTDRIAFQPVRTSLALLQVAREQGGGQFQWRTETYEFVDNPIAIDLLFGSARERLGLENGLGWDVLSRAWEAEEQLFAAERRAAMLYEA